MRESERVIEKGRKRVRVSVSPRNRKEQGTTSTVRQATGQVNTYKKTCTTDKHIVTHI